MAITSDLNLQDKNDNNWVSLKSKRLVNKQTQKRAENVGQNHVKFNNCMKFMLQTSIKLFLLALKANYFISLPFELPPKIQQKNRKIFTSHIRDFVLQRYVGF